MHAMFIRAHYAFLTTNSRTDCTVRTPIDVKVDGPSPGAYGFTMSHAKIDRVK